MLLLIPTQVALVQRINRFLLSLQPSKLTVGRGMPGCPPYLSATLEVVPPPIGIRIRSVPHVPILIAWALLTSTKHRPTPNVPRIGMSVPIAVRVVRVLNPQVRGLPSDRAVITHTPHTPVLLLLRHRKGSLQRASSLAASKSDAASSVVKPNS
uniref:Uncharacterized protein n=1 Tax=Lygus hesperus TaxID=30085 RepID=A0A0A9W6D4_LYGHE